MLGIVFLVDLLSEILFIKVAWKSSNQKNDESYEKKGKPYLIIVISIFMRRVVIIKRTVKILQNFLKIVHRLGGKTRIIRIMVKDILFSWRLEIGKTSSLSSIINYRRYTVYDFCRRLYYFPQKYCTI